MRIAALVLVLMLLVAIASEADGFLWRRKRRTRRGGVFRRRRSGSRRSRNSCCRRRRRIGKRSVEADEDITYADDAILLDDQAFYDKWQPLQAGLSKSRQKRAPKKLKFPSDCLSSKLQNFARKCGLCVTRGGSHIKVCDGSRQVTVIPHHVKSNGTCRNIINILNGRCT